MKVTITDCSFESPCMANIDGRFSVNIHVEEQCTVGFGLRYVEGPADKILLGFPFLFWRIYFSVAKGETYEMSQKEPSTACSSVTAGNPPSIVYPTQGTYTLEVLAGYVDAAGNNVYEDTRQVTVDVTPFQPASVSITDYSFPTKVDPNVRVKCYVKGHVDVTGGNPCTGFTYVDGPTESVGVDDGSIYKGESFTYRESRIVDACTSIEWPGPAQLTFFKEGFYTFDVFAGYQDIAAEKYVPTDVKRIIVQVGAPTPPAEYATLTGRVVETLFFVWKRPSSAAKVSVGTMVAYTGKDGTYIISNIPLGTYTVTVSKPWFETRTKTISLTEAGKTYTLDFEIPQSKWLSLTALVPIFAGMVILIKPKK